MKNAPVPQVLGTRYDLMALKLSSLPWPTIFTSMIALATVVMGLMA